MIAAKNNMVSNNLKSHSNIPSNLPIEENPRHRSIEFQKWLKSLGKSPKRAIQKTMKWNEVLNNEFQHSGCQTFPEIIIVRCPMGQTTDIFLVDIKNGFHISYIKKEETLDPNLQKARILAKNYNYAFVEVYKDKILLIRQ